MAGNWGEAAITAPALCIFAPALAAFALPVSMFAFPVSMFSSLPAWSRLKSPSFLVKTKSGNCVETFLTPLSYLGEAAVPVPASRAGEDNVIMRWSDDESACALATFASPPPHTTAAAAAEVCTMATYPTNRAEFLRWAEAHVAVFETNAAAIGLTVAQALAFKTQVITLRTRTTAQQAARDARKSALRPSPAPLSMALPRRAIGRPSARGSRWGPRHRQGRRWRSADPRRCLTW